MPSVRGRAIVAGVIPSAPLGTDAAAGPRGLGADGGSPARAGSSAREGVVPRGRAAGRSFRFELAAHPGSVAQARRLTRARLSGWSVCADTCDNAALVMSELVTNAIVHTASGRVVCELHDHDDTVRIAVRDEGCAPGEPHPSPQRPDEEHGRGLLLVDVLCRSWGAQEHGPGLLVWAELSRRTDADPDPAEPRGDLGWGARPKPGRPDDSDVSDVSDEERSAEAGLRDAELAGRGESGRRGHGEREQGEPARHEQGEPGQQYPYRTPGQRLPGEHL
ncbi:ATP-binding protein [Streptomyces sp. NPDC012751]|uniref:ATP-binding protein n=1 Tax=Streptomyces sp. NPDC012751 TaxID=3364846 RepID=UPI0036B6A344